MRYSAISVLCLMLTIITGCSRGPVVTVEPVEEPIFTITPTRAPTSTPTTVATVTAVPVPSPVPTEMPGPATDPTETPALTPAATDSAPPTVASSGESTSGEPLLRMVHIRAKSPLEVKRLHQMGLNIAAIRSVPADPNRPPGKDLLTDRAGTPDKELLPREEFIVEAVITAEILDKLRAMGFEVTEIP